MSLCHKCGKPVYFAERKSSLGKDWHWECLRCAECNKVLHPGQHAEHKGIPYCHVPCYGALFGPNMFGHGTAVEAHTNFGTQAQRMPASPARRPDLKVKLKTYNEYYEGKNLQIKSKEVNGRLVLEGALRVYWGVTSPIQLKEKDDVPSSRDSYRRSYCMAISNGLDDQMMKESVAKYATLRVVKKLDSEGDFFYELRESLDELLRNPPPEAPSSERDGAGDSPQNGTATAQGEDGPEEELPSGAVRAETKYGTVMVRGERRRKQRRSQRRLSIINGHVFNVETSVFIPAHGSLTSVTVSSLDSTPKVIQQLLEKFKVENNPKDFCLCTVRSSGETRVLRDFDLPLVERVTLGPLEDDAKIFIMDRSRSKDISHEVAQFVGLPEPVLKGFLDKLQSEEDQEISKVTKTYKRYKKQLEERLSEFVSTQL